MTNNEYIEVAKNWIAQHKDLFKFLKFEEEELIQIGINIENNTKG